MPNPLAIFPDEKLAVIQYLRLRTEITTLTAAGKILTQIPASPNYSTPYIIVQRAGGTSIWPAIDEPSMQIDVVGGLLSGGGMDEVLCGQVARAVRAAILAIANDIVPAGVLSSGHDEVALQWMPDTVSVPTIARFTARYRVILH